MNDDEPRSSFTVADLFAEWGKPKFEIVVTIEDKEGRSEQEILEGIMPALVDAGFFQFGDRYDFKRLGNTVVIGKASNYSDIWDDGSVH